MSGGPERFVTLHGECFEAELRSVDEYQERDGLLHKFYLTDMVSKRGKRLVSVFVSGTLAVICANYRSRVEIVRINAIRRAFDEGTLSFDAAFDEHHYKELSLSPQDFQAQQTRTDAEIRRYIIHKAYWLAHRFPIRAQTGSILYPIPFDEPTDLDYLGITPPEIWRNIRRMEAQGLLEKVLEGHARPSELLLSGYESGELSGRGLPAAISVSTQAADDRKFAQLAIEEARKSAPEDSRIHPKVGVVVVKDGRILATAHRGEIPQCHAEFIALEKRLTDVALLGATVYTTLEPCTSRNHPKVPCATRLAERKVSRVVIGMLDPDDRISGRGQRTLRKAGIATELFPHNLMAEVEELNRDFVRDREAERLLAEKDAETKAADTKSLRKHAAHVDVIDVFTRAVANRPPIKSQSVVVTPMGTAQAKSTFRRFGFAGLCLALAIIMFAYQEYQASVGQSPSWSAALGWLIAAYVLAIICIWMWDRTAETHWVVRSLLSLATLAFLTLIGGTPILRQYRLEHPAPTLSAPSHPPIAKAEEQLPKDNHPIPNDAKPKDARKQEPPTILFPAFMQIMRVEPVPDYFMIAPGNQLAFRFVYRNGGMRPLNGVLMVESIGIVDRGYSEEEVKKEFQQAMDLDLEKARKANQQGDNVGVGHERIRSFMLNPLSTTDANGLLTGNRVLYLSTYIQWVDDTGKPGSEKTCQWLEQPKSPTLKAGELVWNVCKN
jgi:pyrimidine deaminase RibD-like protein